MAKKDDKPAKDQLDEGQEVYYQDDEQNGEDSPRKWGGFIRSRQQVLSIVLLAIIAVGLGYLAYQQFYIKPMAQEAKEEMYMAEYYFMRDSFRLALQGDQMQGFLGFNQIMDEYDMTQQGELAKLYAGLSFLNMGQFEQAIPLLQEFETEEPMLGAIAEGALGDAYIETGQAQQGIDQYLIAADVETNEFLTPYYLQKAAIIYMNTQNYAKAEELFERIRKEYPNSAEGREAEKFIERARLLANKS